MLLKIRHQTSYRFATPSHYGLQQVRKTPKAGHGQTVVSWQTTIEGAHKQLEFNDQHRNHVELFSFVKRTERLVITCEGEVDVSDTSGVVGAHIGATPLWLYRRQTPTTKAGAGVRALVRSVEGETELARLHALMVLLRDAVRYEIGVTQTGWDAEQVLTEGRGVCQDHSHVFISAAREMGLPARYVSGYLRMNGLEEQEAMHAWAEVHLPSLGWVGFDVSNGISPDARYVRVATGLDYTEAAPVIGTRYGGAEEVLDVSIQVAQQ